MLTSAVGVCAVGVSVVSTRAAYRPNTSVQETKAPPNKSMGIKGQFGRASSSDSQSWTHGSSANTPRGYRQTKNNVNEYMIYEMCV